MEATRQLLPYYATWKQFPEQNIFRHENKVEILIHKFTKLIRLQTNTQQFHEFLKLASKTRKLSNFTFKNLRIP